ncbi:MAG: DNA/RNA non-specific endonuclease [Gammaproteobacteria bacterium]
MKKLIAFFMIGLVLPFTVFAEKTPCLGEGGISHCEGSKFVCNNGKYSGTTKICSGYEKKNHVRKKVAVDLAVPSSTSETEKKTKITKQGNVLKLEYKGFTLWLDCKKRGAVKFQYSVRHDTGNEPEAKNFMLDPSVPKECQQTSTADYGHGYDRGRLVPANHLDYSSEAIKQSNYMTNILPQALQMEKSAWLLTEEIIECYRDIDKILVIGGVIWGDNPADDYFIHSHGVKTPDAFWKVVIRGEGQDEQAIAWVVPNSKDATQKHLDNYLVSLGELEIITGEKIPVANYVKPDKPSSSWDIPAGCKKG